MDEIIWLEFVSKESKGQVEWGSRAELRFAMSWYLVWVIGVLLHYSVFFCIHLKFPMQMYKV